MASIDAETATGDAPAPRSPWRFWLQLAGQSPRLLREARWARRHVPRLPEAPGARVGCLPGGRSDHEPGIRLLLIGESPMAGVGVPRFEQSFGAQLVTALHRHLSRPVSWEVLAENGAKVSRLLALGRGAAAADVCICACGVNDVLGLTPVRRWLAAYQALIELRLRQGDHRMLICGLPPIQDFVALPPTLARVLGQRAAQLNHALRAWVAQDSRLIWVPTPALTQRQWLAEDGFHPSAEGARAWAEHCAASLVQPLAGPRRSSTRKTSLPAAAE